MYKFLCISIAFFSISLAHGQSGVYKYAYTKDIDVTKNNTLLQDPWAGGLNNPQFNELDVNFDCYMDIIILDRDGQNIRVFIQDTLNNTYYYAPEYAKFFPNDINDLLMIRDYNNDGRGDIFTNGSPYINHGNYLKVYKNISDTVLKFELITAELPAFHGSNPSSVYVSAFNIPAIDDIDGDGDLDIVAGHQSYLSYQYYENRSSSPDSMEFHYNEACWGKFFQSSDGTVNFGINCKSAGSSIGNSAKRDGGTTITTIDLNADGVKDALLGDPDRPNMLMLNNAGSPTSANMNTVNYQYPKPTADSIKVSSFPVAYYQDVNNDGRSDLIVSPNQYQGSKDTGNVWFYENFGLENLPNFQLNRKNFLGQHQIDVGTMAIPVFADISGDNIPDLLIGNVGYFQSYNPGTFQVTYKSQIAYYRNIGTEENPHFELITEDLAGLGALDLVRISPTFADIDGDGDNDLLFGESNGIIKYYKNTAPLGTEANFVLESDTFMNQNFGVNASPFLFDMNGDDVLDLLVGQKNSNIRLYMNQGNLNVPLFDTAITDTLGGVYNYEPGYPNNATPYIGKLNGDTNNILLAGSYDGWLFFYEGINSNYLGDYSKLDSIKISNSIFAPAVTNLNSTDSLELVIGERAGGLVLFNMDADAYDYSPYPRDTCGHDVPNSIKELKSTAPSFKVYPNPNEGIFKIKFEQNIAEGGNLTIVDIAGKVMYNRNLNAINAYQEIEISQVQLTQGMYIISVESNNTYYRKKLIIQ